MNKLIAIREGDKYRNRIGDILEVIHAGKDWIALVYEDGDETEYPRRSIVGMIENGEFTKIDGG